MDGFQNRCLRYIIGVKPSWISRTPNAQVLARTGHAAASQLLLMRQMQLFGKVLRADQASPLHSCSFIPGPLVPATDRYVRRVGRPCKEFVKEMLQQSVRIFGDVAAAASAASNKRAWSCMLKLHVL